MDIKVKPRNVGYTTGNHVLERSIFENDVSPDFRVLGDLVPIQGEMSPTALQRVVIYEGVKKGRNVFRVRDLQIRNHNGEDEVSGLYYVEDNLPVKLE